MVLLPGDPPRRGAIPSLIGPRGRDAVVRAIMKRRAGISNPRGTERPTVGTSAPKERHREYGGHDPARVPAIGSHGRPSWSAFIPPDLRCLVGDRVCAARRYRPRDALSAAVRGVCRVGTRAWVCQHRHHDRSRVRDAAPQAGVAAAIATTSRQFGLTLGVAVVGAIVTTRFGDGATAELSTASHAAWWTLTACGALVLMLGFIGTTARANRSARRTAAALNPEALGA